MLQDTLTSGDICGMVLGPACSAGASRPTHWALDSPTLDTPAPFIPPPSPSGAPLTKILHLSDLHVHVNYSIGE